jgi:hypothetical protein
MVILHQHGGLGSGDNSGPFAKSADSGLIFVSTTVRR